MSHDETQSQATVVHEENRSAAALAQMMLGGKSFSGHERNVCFLNTGAAPAAAGRFANISVISGLDYPDDGRAVALTDWDHDGDLDMWISNRNGPRLRLMRNDAVSGNHFLALRLVGNGETTNRDAIGARVEVVIANSDSEGPTPKSIKTLRAGEGFLAQSSKTLHFGLGAGDVVEKVSVHWPGGDIEHFTGLHVDRRYRLVQDSGTGHDMTQPARKTTLVRSTQKTSPSSQAARIPLVELLAAPRFRYQGFDGNQHNLSTDSGRLLLVNLWASWCGPCLVELREFTQRYDEVSAAGIDILALSVDGLESSESGGGYANAARVVAEGKFPFSVGQATSSLVADFQELHDLQVPLRRQLPIPSSFLIDQQGRLTVIYKGPLSVDQLLNDVDHSQRNRQERFVRSAPFIGRSIQHLQIDRTADRIAENLLCARAFRLEKASRLHEAARQYADVLKFKPDSFMAHNDLGNVLGALDRHEDAIDHFRRALRIKPDSAMAHANLGIILREKGNAPEAIDQLREALRLRPNYPSAHNGLGICLARQGNTAEAVEHFKRAVRLKPDYDSAHVNLGIALRKQGKIVEAIEHFQEALRIDPKNAAVHTSLGATFLIHGDGAAAVRHYSRSLELKSDSPQALNNLAWIRATHADATLRDGIQAVELAERCCKLTGHETAATLDTLAAAYAEAGRFEDAVRCQAKAIALAPKGDKALLEERLRGFKAGKPFREGS